MEHIPLLPCTLSNAPTFWYPDPSFVLLPAFLGVPLLIILCCSVVILTFSLGAVFLARVSSRKSGQGCQEGTGNGIQYGVSSKRALGNNTPGSEIASQTLFDIVRLVRFSTRKCGPVASGSSILSNMTMQNLRQANQIETILSNKTAKATRQAPQSALPWSACPLCRYRRLQLRITNLR